MPMNICINYSYFSDMSTDNVCIIYCSKHIFCHPGYLYDTTKAIGTTSLGYFATSYQPLTSLVLMTSIICDASQEFNLLPKPKWPKRFCVTNQFQEGVVGVSQWFPEFVFKNSILKTALFGKMCVFFRICSLPNDKHFFK